MLVSYRRWFRLLDADGPFPIWDALLRTSPMRAVMSADCVSEAAAAAGAVVEIGAVAGCDINALFSKLFRVVVALHW